MLLVGLETARCMSWFKQWNQRLVALLASQVDWTFSG